MLTIEKTVFPSPEQWKIIIEGMRNPKNSWDKSDSYIGWNGTLDYSEEGAYYFDLGENDRQLMTTLADGGPVHAKYRRMIPVYMTINAPLYWWKEFDTYKVGTVANSCSTMHKIHAKEFDYDEDFSVEHMDKQSYLGHRTIVKLLNANRDKFLETKNKDYWWQLIQLLPSSYNQRRTVFLNYEVLTGIYRWRKNHKLDEWRTFCKWIETVPCSEIITTTGGAVDG